MQLISRRFEYGQNYTISKLDVDNVWECYVLEDVVRESGVKVQGKTAIPAGIYTLVIDLSTRFKKLMPHILAVPNFEGIRIHSGNTNQDTEGCLLVGTTWTGGDFIGSSSVAFSHLMDKLFKATDAGEKIIIEIIDTK